MIKIRKNSVTAVEFNGTGVSIYLLGGLKVDALKPKDISEEQFISVIEKECGISCDSEWGTLQELGL